MQFLIRDDKRASDLKELQVRIKVEVVEPAHVCPKFRKKKDC